MRNKSNIFEFLATALIACVLVLAAHPRQALATPVNARELVHIADANPIQDIPMGIYALRSSSGHGYLCVDDVASQTGGLAIIDPDSDGWNTEALFFVSNWGSGSISIIHLTSGLRLTGADLGGALSFSEANSDLMQWWQHVPLDDGSVLLGSNEMTIGTGPELGGVWRPLMRSTSDEPQGFEFMPRSAVIALPLSTGAYALDNSQPDANTTSKLSLDLATAFNDQMFYLIPVDDGSHFLLSSQQRRSLLCTTGSAVVLNSSPQPLEYWTFNKVGDDSYQIMLEGSSAVVGLSTQKAKDLVSGMPLGLVPSASESALSFSVAQDGAGYMQRLPLRRALTAFALLVFSATIGPLVDRAIQAQKGPRFKAISRRAQSRAVPSNVRAVRRKARP